MTHDSGAHLDATLPLKEAEPDDPTVLVGVSVPGDAESVREMAYAFAEEFASMGFDASRILALFGSPHYAGAHDALLRLGEDEVRRIVAECVACYGAVRFVVRDAPPAHRFAVDAESGRVVVRAGSGTGTRVAGREGKEC